MLSVKKVLAGRGAVRYYLDQTRHGLADYYLPEPDERTHDDPGRRLSAPGSSWWGGGTEALGLDGEVTHEPFVAMYAVGGRPDGDGFLGRRFRLPAEAAHAKRDALRSAAEIEDAYERWLARHEIRRTGGRASVAAWDCTFSPVKSVSLLWASGDDRVQRQVWAAHTAAVDAGLAYLEEHTAYVRAGRNGVRVLDTTGLVVARMNEWTSRSGDMQLHTHCLVLNRAQTVQDGKWRALDGRALLSARTGAGAVYNRTLEAELTRRLGVVWRDRADGLREIEGVDDELIDAFSTRRRAITTRLAEMVDAYRERHGVEPPPAVVSAMAQHATLTTRPSKRTFDPAEALDAWEATAREQGRRLRHLPREVVGRAGAQRAVVPQPIAEHASTLLDRLAVSGRATFTQHDLLRAALDVVPPGDRTSDELQDAARELVALATASAALLSVAAPDVLSAPPGLQRRDGTSVYARPGRQRWALRSTLDQERWLLDVAAEPSGRPVPADTLDVAVRDHGLGDDQAKAVRDLLGSPRRIGLLVGPAGTGKTRTLRAAVDAWQQAGGTVLGLTVSQAAADVLAAEAEVRSENVAKWLFETDAGRWHLPDGALVLVDEASMVGTPDLVTIIEQARRAGGKVVLVGDTAQLAAIDVGGAFDLLADRHGAVRLHEVRRFTEPWERDASRRLRRRDPSALAAYAMRERIHGGPHDEVEQGLFEAWRADTLTTRGDGEPRSVLMIVATNEQAAVLGERSRTALIEAGIIDDGPTVRLRDNLASAGDVIVTRRNDRRLRTSNRGWVVNGDLWTLVRVHDDGAADVRRHADGSTITLPADYLAEHCHLGYATTGHRAQGMTVDVCHAAISPDASHDQLYVAATRGRDSNHLWVVTDADRDVVRDPDDLPAPEEVLSRVLARRDTDRLAVHHAVEDSLHEMTSLARLGRVFDDASRTATDRWLADELTRHGLGVATAGAAWPSLVARVHEAAMEGHDVTVVIERAIRMRPIDDARSVASALHWRIDQITTTEPPTRSRGPLASLPPGDNPAIDIARQAAELIRDRWEQLRTALAQTTEPLPWAQALGPRPVQTDEASEWVRAATAVTAYRERYGVPDHAPMLGPRPAATRPDARAAWDHARHQADLYLAHRLQGLSPTALDRLDAEQRAVLATPPHFDPARLQHARRSLQAAVRARATVAGTERCEIEQAIRDWHRHIAELEQAATRHDHWRAAAEHAVQTLRQTDLGRHTPSRIARR